MAGGLDGRSPGTAPAGIRWVRIAMLIGGAVALYVLGRLVADMVVGQFGLHVRARNEPLLHRIIMTATLVYIVFLAIPFVPGAEIGLAMLLVFGPRLAFLVYASTVVALTLAYLVGRSLPVEFAARAFGLVGLAKARDFVDRLAPLSPGERMDLLVRDSPARLVPYLVRHRYVALAVLLNLPGNFLLGGGGGIALLAGMTGLFPIPRYLLTVAVAVAPVPLIVSFTA